MTATDRLRLRDQARDAFLRAAAALTEYPTSDVLAFALLEGSFGLKQLAEADEDKRAHDIVIAKLEEIARGPG